MTFYIQIILFWKIPAKYVKKTICDHFSLSLMSIPILSLNRIKIVCSSDLHFDVNLAISLTLYKFKDWIIFSCQNHK